MTKPPLRVHRTFAIRRPCLLNPTPFPLRPFSAIVATLSTGPVGIGDKQGDTNSTIVRRCIREDGRILQPDKPATSVDSMFAQPSDVDVAGAGAAWRSSPTGHVWATNTRMHDVNPSGPDGAMSHAVWHWVLSIDVTSPWNLHGSDLYPMIPNTVADAVGPRGSRTTAKDGGEGWVAHSWFTGHGPTNCKHGAKALATGCVSAVVGSAEDIPALHNARPIMVTNDTHVFDLLELAPVVHGWALLGEVGKFVRVSQARFDAISFSESGVHVVLSGTAGETTEVTALQPLGGLNGAESVGDAKDWLIHVKSAQFNQSGKATIAFSAAATPEGLAHPAPVM